MKASDGAGGSPINLDRHANTSSAIFTVTTWRRATWACCAVRCRLLHRQPRRPQLLDVCYFVEVRCLVPLILGSLLVATACGGDGDSVGNPATTVMASTVAPTTVVGSPLDLAGAAAGAQQAIDLGDDLGDCPWDPAAVAAAVVPVASLVAEFSGPIENNGQVFSGGEVDIAYCEILPDSGQTAATDGIEEFRIDVHPGTADLQQYLDEEWPGDAADASTSALLGGTVSFWCLDADRCIAAWQGDGLFVGLVVQGVVTASADDAVAALGAALPVVVAGLAA